MSEKRFTLTDWHEVKDNGKIMTVDEVVGKLNEQQDIISQLQDLCGESDGENAKLRIENGQLRKELDNFKPVMFQDVRKGTVILYSKGD